MTDKIRKFVDRLTPKQREVAKLLILRVKLSDTEGLDVKRLQGHEDMYRVRKGRLRIVYLKNATEFRVVHMDWRDDQTYRGF